jgi:Mg2+-importing ATPase
MDALNTMPTLARDASLGLSRAEAAQRLTRDGPNVLESGRRQALVVQLLARLKNPLTMLLLAASGMAAATGDSASATIIIVMVALSVTMDFAQEQRAGRAAEGLRKAASVRASVVRDGKVLEIPAEDVVTGDLVHIAAGDLVPADGTLLEAKDLFVNQALLTGEPYPVEKHLGATMAPNELATDTVFMGTSVVSGMGRFVVSRTGSRTSVGEIGRALNRRPPPGAFEVGTKNFGLLILRLALLMVLFVIFVNLARDRPLLETFLFAIALAVGLTPELLPMVISVTLAKGALRMSKKKVLVKRLAAIHDLGSMDILCTDKTGTLTDACISLSQHLDPNGRSSARVLELAYLNSHFETGLRSPMDEAILQNEVDLAGWTKLDEVPFDFERRRVSVLVAHRASRTLVIKGAFEDVLALSTHYEANGPNELLPLDEARRRDLVERFEALGREGYRVLGVAWKAEAADCSHIVLRDEAELVFAGFAVFEDPPKPGVGAAMRSLAGLGVSVVIVTGDNELVAQHVCKQVGVVIRGVLNGSELQALDDSALAARVDTTNLFCRLNPAQKNRVILAFKQRGHVVGYLGDGINDAPSLQSADVGISVDSAVDVAKDAADLILLERDLSVLEQGVLEGRRTLGNIIKYILMGTSSNFGNMFSMAGASLFLPFLPMLPMQILVNNFLYDVSEVAIPTDTVDDAFVARPHRWDIAFIRKFMMVIGPVSSVFDFVTFYVLLRLFAGDERLFHAGWFVESLATQVLVIFIIRTRGNPFRSRPSRPLLLTSLAVVMVAIVLPFTPLGTTLGFAPLPLSFFAILLPLVATYLAAVEVVKRWFYRRFALV